MRPPRRARSWKSGRCEKKRDDLYEQMVAQIDREVKTVAQERGVSTVVSTVAPAGGVDLTGDAMKDIETLHE